MRLTLPLILSLLASPLSAQDTSLMALETSDTGRGWEAVGRLDVDRGGFCTASLIEEKLILTAAHCLYDSDGSPIAAERFTFLAGLRDGRAEATRGVLRVTPHPDYVHRSERPQNDAVAVDIAVLELDRPIRQGRVTPFTLATEPQTGAQVGVVSYANGRANVPSLQEVCEVLDRQGGIVVMTCSADFGASGSPVFWMNGGTPRIVSVISAKGRSGARDVSLGTSLADPLARLLDAHARGVGALPVPVARTIGVGTRDGTGAKFVRP
ncbi:trypsin-like serine protease [Loktanella sp. TSTF-M6]|uniref:Trypsin-like serine protease n=1 Tax=Loktanella gaetbuli TaxID=2881335 RepID=A0ABS8BW59_9RHOB|nr:trypsin-like serine protease [Loktanella gaetbuli]MCB5199991.1 trypsin-like serine protease [Loktanella gaetbuli]